MQFLFEENIVDEEIESLLEGVITDKIKKVMDKDKYCKELVETVKVKISEFEKSHHDLFICVEHYKKGLTDKILFNVIIYGKEKDKNIHKSLFERKSLSGFKYANIEHLLKKTFPKYTKRRALDFH